MRDFGLDPEGGAVTTSGGLYGEMSVSAEGHGSDGLSAVGVDRGDEI